VGIRYGPVFSADTTADMPSPARALVLSSIQHFQRTDRGVVRNSNDKTMDTRAASFRDWLISAGGYSDVCQLAQLTPAGAIALLGAFLDHVAVTPYNSKGNLRMSNTLSHYLQAAYRFLRPYVSGHFTIYEPDTQPPKIVPFLADRIAQRRKWQKPREKREPYTYAMLETFYRQVQQSTSLDVRANLGRHALIFDVIRLGLFTGSRVSEYAQNKGPAGFISRVPQSHHDYTERGKPIAFITSDFIFLDHSGHICPSDSFFDHPEDAKVLHLQFRHDKSGRNFTIRKFGPGQDWLCPIRASLSILCRAKLLRISPLAPVCAYQEIGTSTSTFLRAQEITDTMRAICVDTYPDPQHFLRQRLHCFVSHSNRVTAAVALRRAGCDIPTIAFRLRWKPESVDHYLRECTQEADESTAAAIHGAMRD
jgi:hypothetical protein